MGPEIKATPIDDDVKTTEVTEEWTTEGTDKVVNANVDVDPNLRREEAEAQATEILTQDETPKQLKDLQEIMKAFEEDKTGSLSSLKEDYKNLTTNIINQYDEIVKNVVDGKSVSPANNTEQLKSLDTSDSGAEVSWEGKEVQIASSIEGLDVSTMSKAEAEKAAWEIMSNQPQEVQKQISEINNVLSNGTKEQKDILSGVIKDMTDQIDKLYKQIQETSERKQETSEGDGWDTVPGNEEETESDYRWNGEWGAEF